MRIYWTKVSRRAQPIRSSNRFLFGLVLESREGGTSMETTPNGDMGRLMTSLDAFFETQRTRFSRALDARVDEVRRRTPVTSDDLLSGDEDDPTTGVMGDIGRR